ncbi:MAG: hypothetical protein ABW221_04860 [Vicinamibacteria bacterium]
MELFPDATVRLSGARYAPAETDFLWTGWIGAGAGLFRVNGVTGWGMAEVETILGDTLRPFEANQANYHLQLGFRRTVGRVEVEPFFHHVSRHYVDRPKTQAVDWNVLGFRGAMRFEPGGRPVRVEAGLGRTTQASLPGYQWEATAAVAIAAREGDGASPYARASARYVTVRDLDTPETLQRGAFLDRAAEAGVRFSRGGRALELFAAGERRNDVFLEEPGALTRALFGLRILARTR